MTKRRLSIILHSSDYSRIHFGLAMAAAAAATDRPVTLFFTMGGLRFLTPDWGEKENEVNENLGIATLNELISANLDLGTEFQICEMGLQSEGLALHDLRADINIKLSGIVSFLTAAESEDTTPIFV
ncbi:MAG: DsrE family protein [Rhodospirillaceae bacterium]